ncbi:hypothetical protein D7X94_07035 [Acutalibacter sp. 1XD8-33]|nr:hypothetical protein D7X94_07035 [Acutalibacter sp. 1XD8-33]
MKIGIYRFSSWVATPPRACLKIEKMTNFAQKRSISRRKPQVNLAIDEDFQRGKWPLLGKKTMFSIFQTSPSSKEVKYLF